MIKRIKLFILRRKLKALEIALENHITAATIKTKIKECKAEIEAMS